MADSPQLLQEFLQNLITDLDSGAITVHEAYAAASQYGYLRHELSEASLVLSEAATISNEELTHVFFDVISQTLAKLSELPNFQAQQPDIPESEQSIRNVAGLQQVATNRIREQTTTQSTKEKRRSFVHDLVNRFSSTVPTATDTSVDAFVNRATAAASRESTPTQQTDRFIQHLANSIDEASQNTLSPEQKSSITANIQAATVNHADVLSEQLKQTRREMTIYTALFETLDMKRPDVFVDVVLNAPTSEDIGISVTRAEKLARVAQSLEESAGKREGKLHFFSANGAKGLAGGLQKGADSILSLIGEPVRGMVLHEKVRGSFRSMLRNTQQFADRLGENFVKSALFTHISQDLTKQLSEKARGGQAGSLFGDVFSTVFRGPLNQPLVHSTKESILDYFELARANAAAPKERAFLAPGILPWDIYRTYASHQEGITNYAFRKPRGPFSSFGFGAIGSFFGDIFSSAVDKVTSFALINPGLPGQLSASRRAAAVPTRVVDDMPLFVALVVVIVLILLFIFPSPLNLNMLSHSSKVSALLAALSNSALDQVNNVCEAGSTLPICQFEACTGDCRWPTTGAIIQGPFATCGDTTHRVVDAIDFQGSYLRPIYSITDGEVIRVVGGCADNPAPSGGSTSSGCNSNYGNYVEVQTPSGDVLRYSHLSMLFIDNIQKGSIKKGDPIGKMDNNGSSGSHHLHLEVRGGSPANSRIASYLPGDTQFAQQLYQCNNDYGCKQCPQM